MPLENFLTFTSVQSASFTRSRRPGMRAFSVAWSTPDMRPKTDSVWRAVR